MGEGKYLQEGVGGIGRAQRPSAGALKLPVVSGWADEYCRCKLGFTILRLRACLKFKEKVGSL